MFCNYFLYKEWFLRCFIKFPFCVNAFSHDVHLNGLTLSWVRQWSSKFQHLVKDFFQLSLKFQMNSYFKFGAIGFSISLIWYLYFFSSSKYSTLLEVIIFSIKNWLESLSIFSVWIFEGGMHNKSEDSSIFTLTEFKEFHVYVFSSIETRGELEYLPINSPSDLKIWTKLFHDILFAFSYKFSLDKFNLAIFFGLQKSNESWSKISQGGTELWFSSCWFECLK